MVATFVNHSPKLYLSCSSPVAGECTSVGVGASVGVLGVVPLVVLRAVPIAVRSVFVGDTDEAVLGKESASGLRESVRTGVGPSKKKAELAADVVVVVV
mmetsp:Transcript_49679/g.144078  ORF Transcript_49679/g.144078 Transcript_49679/m.144078 type:complete len:99 (+) Transcript_49679:340-636(+)